MGVLRVLLALSVVIIHCDGTLSTRVLVGGQFAVELFFIISGFYMALVLHEKYPEAGPQWLFYGNRLLRLLPAYYLIIALVLIVPLVASVTLGRAVSLGQMALWKSHGGQLSPALSLWMKWLHVTPIAQELPWAGHLDTNAGLVHFSPPGQNEGVINLNSFMLIPPAWSLSLELQFYFLAPSLVRRHPAVLAAILALTIWLRHLLPLLPFATPAFWNNQTLLCELGYFLMGTLSYRLLRHVRSNATLHAPSKLGWIGLGVMVGLLFAYPWFPETGRRETVSVALALSIPYIFQATASKNWDRALGELSYPLYLGHWLIMNAWYALAATLSPLTNLPKFGHIGIVILLSLIFSVAIHQWVEKPIDRFRQSRVRRLKERLAGA